MWGKIHINQVSGESAIDYSKRAYDIHVRWWMEAKKRSGEWLSKEEYEKKTGRKGRKD